MGTTVLTANNPSANSNLFIVIFFRCAELYSIAHSKQRRNSLSGLRVDLGQRNSTVPANATSEKLVVTDLAPGNQFVDGRMRDAAANAGVSFLAAV